MPEQDQIRLATLGKLAEECNELAARAMRCIIQGVGEVDPDSGRTNRDEMSREMSDVLACFTILTEEMGITPTDSRMSGKVRGFRRWHRMIRGETV